jgi:dual specificity tyrosine-phosphorylation-regulated kinase 2/3/4
LKCWDHKNKEAVAIKILKNWKKLHKQGKIEIKILETLRDSDHENQKNIVRIKSNFTFRSHVCIGFEMLSLNLYQFIKNNDFQGFSMALTKRFSIQVLEALDYMHMFSIVHCDLKPENILLVKPNKSQIKLIDYGSSCFELERFYTYI